MGRMNCGKEGWQMSGKVGAWVEAEAGIRAEYCSFGEGLKRIMPIRIFRR